MAKNRRVAGTDLQCSLFWSWEKHGGLVARGMDQASHFVCYLLLVYPFQARVVLSFYHKWREFMCFPMWQSSSPSPILYLLSLSVPFAEAKHDHQTAQTAQMTPTPARAAMTAQTGQIPATGQDEAFL